MVGVTNFLQQVQTYQRSTLGYLQNLVCFIPNANTRFKDFNRITANLGSSVTFDLPPRFTDSEGLVASFQAANQLVNTLTCDQGRNVSYEFTNQERIFNVEKPGDEYLPSFMRSAMLQLANRVEGNVALNANSHVPVMTVVDGDSVATGALHTESGPFRFFGDGINPINNVQQLAQIQANYSAFGSVAENERRKIFLPSTVIPSIISTMLNQFVLKRNEEKANSWDLGHWDNVDYYKSNLLPEQTAGNVGENQDELTVVSTNDPTGQNITQITLSGASVVSDPNAVKSGDLGQFLNNSVKYLTYIGGFITSLPAQFRVTADAASTGAGQVTINITPGFTIGMPNTTNIGINTNIVAGMKVKLLPSHRCGLLIGGEAFYLAMPRLPDQRPYDSVSEYDDKTGVAMRLTYGTLFGRNQSGWIHDCIWGSHVVPHYAMRIVFPLSQA